MILRRTMQGSALALVASAALFAAVLLGPTPGTTLAWAAAYAIVILATLGVAGLAWIVLSLPAGAPIRTVGLRVAAGAAGIGLVWMLVA